MPRQSPECAILTHSRFVVCFTRADYRNAASGIEKYLSEQAALLAQKGISCVSVFPLRTRRHGGLDAWLSRFWGVVADGQWQGFFCTTDLAAWLAGCQQGGNGGLLEIQLHHLQDYPLEVLASFLAAVSAPVRLFVHDYHLLCRQYNLLRNGAAFCGTDAPSLEKCAGCAHWEAPYFPAMRAFLERLRGRVDILVPSEAAQRVMLGALPEWRDNTRVVPHWRVAEGVEGASPSPVGQTLKLGFVGLPSRFKGWHVFESVGHTLTNQQAPYEFFHFGRPAREGRDFIRNVPVSFVRDGRDAMTTALRTNGVEMVVLWSICPETYSYTLYESLQAGAMIVTHPDSGNIADEVRRSDVGVVLESERALLDYLTDVEQVRADVVRCRRNSLKRFGSMRVNDDIVRLLPQHPTVLPAPSGRVQSVRVVNALYRLKQVWRRWSGRQ